MSETLLIIGHVWPEPNSSAAGSRMLQLIDFFLKENYKITFASSASKTDSAFDLKSLQITTVSIQLNDESFDDFILDLNPTVVMFDRFMVEEQYGWRVSENCPNAIKILDTEDLHFLRKGRGQAIRDKAEFSSKYLYNDFAKREIASIYRCDLSLIISEFEMGLLTNQFKIRPELLLYLPFVIDEVQDIKIEYYPKFNEREHFVTIGNFRHPPNLDSVKYLKKIIWPIIQTQLPKAQMHVYGAYVNQEAQNLHDEKIGFLVKGFAKDIESVMKNARLCLVPLRFGAGLKGKIFDAMKYGAPCIMTDIAAEGIFGNLGPNGYNESNPEDFADLAIRLYNDENQWNIFQNNGYNVLTERFSRSSHFSFLKDRIDNLIANRENLRQENFLGQILNHHSLQSTKYMSKWIEEKNKN